jgi:hypothetical protein
MKHLSKRWRVIVEKWPTLTFYQRFESVIALALTLIITAQPTRTRPAVEYVPTRYRGREGRADG